MFHIPEWAKCSEEDEAPDFQVGESEANERKFIKLDSRRDSDSSTEDDECLCCKIDPVLCMFRIFHSFAILTILLGIVSNGCAISKQGFNDVRDVMIRIFTILFSVALIFVEMSVRLIVRRVRVLENWILIENTAIVFAMEHYALMYPIKSVGCC